MALTACSAPATHDAAPAPSAAAALSGGAAPATAAASDTSPSALTVVSVLGDSHSGWPGSWFRGSVANGAVPGVAPGVLASEPGRTSIELLAWVGQATARRGVVLVQAGTNDLLIRRATPPVAAQGVEALVTAVSAQHVRAILVSVPPSGTLGAATNQLNALLEDWSHGHQVPWLDVTRAVAQADGTWQLGLSDDGVHANAAGGERMASAARAQLPGLLGPG
ncbi:SGNH/GDSL hydrolase family protein [Sinomonas notoginsengisoli]|uniref:SGNH/GDSL hydrolase family protein n=1 Tax=Sinomonas notoginsengisoli TaxID=1457311 RepID=UPI001F3FA1FF|nr:SGNH/GDSL hydrolase family protein [Sinomonas notoginsengisoli]